MRDGSYRVSPSPAHCSGLVVRPSRSGGRSQRRGDLDGLGSECASRCGRPLLSWGAEHCDQGMAVRDEGFVYIPTEHEKADFLVRELSESV
jgi:hypothetical protein